MQNTQYSEIESKYGADEVSPLDFDRWAKSLKPFSKKRVQGWDTYYRCGKAVVRHRYNDNYNCLTVKLRKSSKSTTDRVEVDLLVDGAPEDTVQFLNRTGYVPEFTIWKKALIYHVDDDGVEISLVVYDIKADHHPDRRFIEVEVEKSPNVTPKVAKKILKRWDKTLRERFRLDPALNKSLYELYGSRKYGVVTK